MGQYWLFWAEISQLAGLLKSIWPDSANLKRKAIPF